MMLLLRIIQQAQKKYFMYSSLVAILPISITFFVSQYFFSLAQLNIYLFEAPAFDDTLYPKFLVVVTNVFCITEVFFS